MDITESASSTGTSAGRTSSRRMRGVDPTASLGASEGGKDTTSGQQQKQIVFRRRARRQTLSGVEAGYSTFTAGISLGWYAELGSLKFRQVSGLSPSFLLLWLCSTAFFFSTCQPCRPFPAHGPRLSRQFPHVQNFPILSQPPLFPGRGCRVPCHLDFRVCRGVHGGVYLGLKVQ